jgi:hypothetical protein
LSSCEDDAYHPEGQPEEIQIDSKEDGDEAR